jgi:antitoxin component YwqK of YwqJK toxin-antitoxin module
MAMIHYIALSALLDDRRHLKRVITAEEWEGHVPDGVYHARDESGLLRIVISYESGLAHGNYLSYWSNGNLATEGQHKNGKQDGEWSFFNEQGALEEVIHFDSGVELFSKRYK